MNIKCFGMEQLVKFTGCTPERNSNSEGYFYWDSGEQKVAMLIVNEKGIYQKGFVTAGGRYHYN